MSKIYTNKINLRDKENNFYSLPNWVLGNYQINSSIKNNTSTNEIKFTNVNTETPLSNWTIGDIIAFLALNSNNVVSNGGGLYIDTAQNPPVIKIIKDGTYYPILDKESYFTAKNGVLKLATN